MEANAIREIDPDTAIRRAWLDELVVECQRVAGRCTTADRDEARCLLVEFAKNLPVPTNRVEWLLLRGILLDVAYQSAHSLHGQLHRRAAADCGFSPASLLDRFWPAQPEAAISDFGEWIDALFGELNRIHPSTLGSSVRRLIRRDYQRPWNLTKIARTFHTAPGQVRRSFKREFGVSIREYQRLVRLVAALGELRHSKVSAIALQVGYRSKKNFYRAFARLTGLTPTAFRRLPPDGAAQVEQDAAVQLSRRARS